MTGSQPPPPGWNREVRTRPTPDIDLETDCAPNPKWAAAEIERAADGVADVVTHPCPTCAEWDGCGTPECEFGFIVRPDDRFCDPCPSCAAATEGDET